MIVSYLNLDLIDDFGSAGNSTLSKLVAAAEFHSLKINYDREENVFTLVGSSDYTIERIKEIFARKDYICWEPDILEKTDVFGNKLLVLRCLSLFASDDLPIVQKKVVEEVNKTSKLSWVTCFCRLVKVPKVHAPVSPT